MGDGGAVATGDGQGTSSKVVLVAIMRKLIVLANALLRDGRTWSEIRA
jgi:hypothetical protein